MCFSRAYRPCVRRLLPSYWLLRGIREPFFAASKSGGMVAIILLTELLLQGNDNLVVPK